MTTGGLAALRHSAGVVLIRACRAGLPADSVAMLAAAAVSRLRGRVLVVDDLQWADPFSVAALPLIAEHVPVVAALTSGVDLGVEFGEDATVHALPPLNGDEAERLVSEAAPTLSAGERTQVRQAAGDNPLALVTLARSGVGETAERGAAFSIASALAGMDAKVRTGLATLGLLGRPAHVSLLGTPVVEALRGSGLAVLEGEFASPASPWTARIAAGALEEGPRRDLHARLAESTTGLESARHAYAAGMTEKALETALAAAEADTREATAALTLAAAVDGTHALAAAKAAVRDHQAELALTLLEEDHSPEAVRTKVYAHLTLANPMAARAMVDSLDDDHPETWALRLLTVSDPGSLADEVEARWGEEPCDAALHAALAAARGHGLWEAAASAELDGAHTVAYWCRWKAVNRSLSRARLVDAKRQALASAEQAGRTGHVTWKARFLAMAALTNALTSTDLERLIDSVRRARGGPLPSDIATLLAATVALASADSGDLGAAASHLDGIAHTHPLVAWIEAEYAWLDGKGRSASSGLGGDLADGLLQITRQWVAFETGESTSAAVARSWPDPIGRTLSAWHSPSGSAFRSAAEDWEGVSLREKIRSLLAASHHMGPQEATGVLLEAEKLASDAGLAVLDGKVKRALRRLGVRRDKRSARGLELTSREQEILTFISGGHPTRRIAETLGITQETVETHIRSAMRKLGAKTRTEAAVKFRRSRGRGV
ncbi:helix-turn-helix transcriptional regulator [Salininema proteolyticum]|uniref:LuxR C-terminal-related transcriptional regulator n=1 Tax=Salininema proteolyticum TaxID=1607685 RepID=A0ABV8TUA2_9ACTN